MNTDSTGRAALLGIEIQGMHYSRTARYYHWLEAISFGRRLRTARLAHLDRLSARGSVTHALLVGEGNGSFLVPFVRRYPGAWVTVVDESLEMLEVARSRLEVAGLGSERVEFLLGDARALHLPERTYDLIVTLFFFDNFTDEAVRSMMTSLSAHGTEDGQWLLADFHLPESGWRAWRARLWLKLLYGYFGRVACVTANVLPDMERALTAEGYACTARTTSCGELLYSALYQKRPVTSLNQRDEITENKSKN
jgi:ubiquinone/menaquinone biosynthesis C-methylase UbiE